MPVLVKRVYDEPAPGDGFRVLVDRLWPRGLTKERAALDGWLKDVAPSAGLRSWFHREGDFAAFADRYVTELAANPALAELRELVAGHPVVTLLYGAKADPEHNHAAVLRGVLAGGQT
ncbi:MAG TPA: DUF488 family protein [Actinoplanes sp.]|nr:DUF488 family protein [Actinoplanes sp.]